MKKTTAAALTLGGCAAGPAEDSTSAPDRPSKVSSSLKEQHVDLEDGRTVVCVTFRQGYGGGLSCDWAGAK